MLDKMGTKSIRVEASDSLLLQVAYNAPPKSVKQIDAQIQSVLGPLAHPSIWPEGTRVFEVRYSTKEAYNAARDKILALKPELERRSYGPLTISKQANFDIEAQMAGLTLYHGTHIEYLPSILREGLKPARLQSVYVTADFEKAARYGLYSESRHRIEEEPVVLELYLSKPKRVRKLKYDPYDRESLWSEDSDDFERDELLEIKDFLEEGWEAVRESLGRPTMALNRHELFSPRAIDNEDSLEGLVGKNLWRVVVEYLQEKTPIDRVRLMRLVQRAYPAGDYGYLVVREDGSLALNEDWYTSREQLYMKGDVSPRAIKRVWLLKDRHPDAQGPERRAGALELPQETRDRLNSSVEKLDKLRRKLELGFKSLNFIGGPNKAYDVETLYDVFEKLEEYKDLLEDVEGGLASGLGSYIYQTEVKEAEDFYGQISALRNRWGTVHEAVLARELEESPQESSEQIEFPFVQTMLDEQVEFLIEPTRTLLETILDWSENMQESLMQEWGETQKTKPFVWVGVDPKDAIAMFSSAQGKTANSKSICVKAASLVESGFSLEAAKVDRLIEKYPALSAEIEFLDEADPSPTKRYLEWAVQRLVQGEPRERIEVAMEQFDRAQNRLEGDEKNIQRYQTVQEVLDAAKKALSVESRRDKDERIKREGTELVVEADGARTYLIKTKEASMLYGKGTKWCTAGTRFNTFDQYASNGVKLYYTMGPKGKTALALMRRGDDVMGEMYDAQNNRLTAESFPYPETLRQLVPNMDEWGVEFLIFVTFEGEPKEAEMDDFDYGPLSDALLASYQRRFDEAIAKGLGARIYWNGALLSTDFQRRLFDTRSWDMTSQMQNGTLQLIKTGAAAYRSVDPQGTEGETEMPWASSIEPDDEDTRTARLASLLSAFAHTKTAASIQTRLNGGKGSLYLDRVLPKDTVCFLEPVADEDLVIDQDALGSVIQVDLSGPRLLVDVIARRGANVREERVWTSPDNVVLMMNPEDRRLG